jgi:hypothetical protein
MDGNWKMAPTMNGKQKAKQNKKKVNFKPSKEVVIPVIMIHPKAPIIESSTKKSAFAMKSSLLFGHFRGQNVIYFNPEMENKTGSSNLFKLTKKTGTIRRQLP